MSTEDKARQQAVIAEARRRVRAPGLALVAIGVAHLAAAATVWLYGRLAGDAPTALSGVALVLPGLLALFGGLLIRRRLTGWNPAFAGMLIGSALWLLAFGAATYGALGAERWLMLAGPVVCMATVIWLAQVAESAHVRAARGLLAPLDPTEDRIHGPL